MCTYVTWLAHGERSAILIKRPRSVDIYICLVLLLPIILQHEFLGSWNIKNQPWSEWTVSMWWRKLLRCRKMAVNFDFTISANYPCEMAFGIPRSFFPGIPRSFFLGRIKVWIFTVNSDWEFLGIPNHNSSGSKNLEIPRNSQKLPEISRNSKFIANRTWNS